MADDMHSRMVINDLLCYSTKKFSRIPIKQLKSTVADFYNPTDISTAKEALFEEFEVISDKSVKIQRRRKDSVSRTPNEIDDIFSMITHLDENNLTDKLPMFVSNDPDKMPSVKLTEGDLALMLVKLGKVQDCVSSVKDTVSEINAKLKATSLHLGGNVMPSAVPPVPRPASLLLAARSDVRPTVGPSQAARSSGVPIKHRSFLPSTATDGAADCDDSSDIENTEGSANVWEMSVSRRNKMSSRKRLRESNSPSTELHVVPSSFSKNNTANVTKKLGKNTLFGSSTTCSLKASKHLQLPKSVFMVGNLDGECTVDEIKTHLNSVEIRVVTCFELPQSDRRPDDNKAFRVCIIAADKAKMLDKNNWALGVSVRHWRFKDKDVNGPSNAAFGNAHGESGPEDTARKMEINGASTATKSADIPNSHSSSAHVANNTDS